MGSSGKAMTDERLESIRAALKHGWDMNDVVNGPSWGACGECGMPMDDVIKELVDEVDRMREVSLENAMNDAARDLPEGWQIRFTVENGYGIVELGRPFCDDHEELECWIPFEFDDPQESFASVVRAALAQALEEVP